MANIERTIKIARLFPNILFLHGDRGNAKALQRVATGLGLETEVVDIGLENEAFDPEEYDIILCPPGEMGSFETIINWLAPYKDGLKTFVEQGKVLLVTGTSQCIFGKEYVRIDGSKIEGLGLIDCSYNERKAVYGDDLYFKTEHFGGELECFGIQIQMMDVISNEKPFGYLLYGFGNTGKDRKEGAIKYNSIFTNAVGPLLVLNPWIAKEILLVAAENRKIPVGDNGINMDLEEKSLAAKKEFISCKATNLTNCL